MTSNEQRIEILKRMSSILNSLQTCKNIREIKEKTGISSSTIQRYLNKKEYYMELLEEGLLKEKNIEIAMNYSKQWLNRAKREGLKNGGVSSQRKYGYTKNETGQFNGHYR